jgi:hypothetical protein
MLVATVRFFIWCVSALSFFHVSSDSDVFLLSDSTLYFSFDLSMPSSLSLVAVCSLPMCPPEMNGAAAQATCARPSIDSDRFYCLKNTST